VDLSNSKFDYIDEPSLICSNKKGDVAVAWLCNVDKRESLYLSFRPQGCRWTVPEVYSSLEDINFYPGYAFTIDSLGKCSVGWSTWDNSKRGFQVVSKSFDKSWFNHFELASPESNLESIKFAPGGDIISVGVSNIIQDKDRPWNSVRVIQAVRKLENETGLIWETISDPSVRGSSSAPKIFFNEVGKGLAIWEVNNYCPDVLTLAASWHEDGSWTPQQEIVSISKSRIGCCSYQAAINRNGDAVVCWPLSTYIDGQDLNKVQATTYSNEGWSPVVDLDIGINDEEHPQCLINQDGHTIVIYEGTDDDQIHTAFKPSGEDWMLSLNAEPVPGSNYLHAIQCTPQGDFIAIWVNEVKNRRYIYGAVFSPELRKWTDPVLLSPASVSCSYPQFVITGDRQGVVSWIATDGFDEWIQVADLTY
jgi:hypothetical protein